MLFSFLYRFPPPPHRHEFALNNPRRQGPGAWQEGTDLTCFPRQTRFRLRRRAFLAYLPPGRVKYFPPVIRLTPCVLRTALSKMASTLAVLGSNLSSTWPLPISTWKAPRCGAMFALSPVPSAPRPSPQPEPRDLIFAGDWFLPPPPLSSTSVLHMRF